MKTVEFSCGTEVRAVGFKRHGGVAEAGYDINVVDGNPDCAGLFKMVIGHDGKKVGVPVEEVKIAIFSRNLPALITFLNDLDQKGWDNATKADSKPDQAS